VRIVMKLDAEGVKKTLGAMLAKLENKRPALKIIGRIVVDSVNKNFEAQGRPAKWRPSRRSMGGVLKRLGGGVHKTASGSARAIAKHGSTLTDTGRLVRSINASVVSDSQVAVGTNVVYAAVHQFGAKKGEFGRGKVVISQHQRKTKSGRYVTVRPSLRRQQFPWGDIPARPFLLVQDEDWVEIKAAMAQHVFGKKVR
jgi:phage gpG-like protein